MGNAWFRFLSQQTQIIKEGPHIQSPSGLSRMRSMTVDPAFRRGQHVGDTMLQIRQAFGRHRQRVSQPADLRVDLEGNATHGQDFQTGRRLAGETDMNFFQRQLLVEFQLDDLLAADDAQRQRQREDQTWLGMKALRAVERKLAAAQQALEGAHQVVMAQES